MSKLKTYKDLADELGVNKDKVKYQARKLPSEYLVKEKGITYITNEGVEVIKGNLRKLISDSINKPFRKIQEQLNSEEKELTSEFTSKNNELPTELPTELLEAYLSNISNLEKQVELLEKQLKVKDDQLERLDKKLDNQQSLALVDKQSLLEAREEIKTLKALQNNHSEEKEKPRKWWQRKAR